MERMIEALQCGHSVILDCTNITRASRKTLIDQVRSVAHEPYELVACSFLTGPEECKSRQQGRERKVPAKVIDRMYQNMTQPGYDEGWDQIYQIF